MRWLETLEQAVNARKIPLRNPENHLDNLPYAVPKSLRTFWDQVHFRDVNDWLDDRDWTDARLDGWSNAEAVNSASVPVSTGLTKEEVLAKPWPGTNEKFSYMLSDVPKWLESSIVERGKAGKRSSLWNPAMLGVCLCTKGNARTHSIRQHLIKNFPEWLEEWDRLSEHVKMRH